MPLQLLVSHLLPVAAALQPGQAVAAAEFVQRLIVFLHFSNQLVAAGTDH
jgi:hypothetical protein